MRLSKGLEGFLVKLRAASGARPMSVESLEGRRLLAVTAGISGNDHASEGVAYALALSASPTAPTPTIDRWEVNWGDGSTTTYSGSPSSASHVYADGINTYTIRADVFASGTVGGTYSASTYATKAITVDDVAPTRSVSGDSTAYFYETFTLTRAYSDVTADPATSWTINWGDGTTSNVSGNPNYFTHTYEPTTLASRTITGSVTNKDGTFAFTDFKVDQAELGLKGDGSTTAGESTAAYGKIRAKDDGVPERGTWTVTFTLREADRESASFGKDAAGNWIYTKTFTLNSDNNWSESVNVTRKTALATDIHVDLTCTDPAMGSATATVHFNAQ